MEKQKPWLNRQGFCLRASRFFYEADSGFNSPLRLCLRPVGETTSSSVPHQPVEPRLSAAVSASAGTGKTYLLVTRMIRLLLAGARPDSILALTFTRKAAAEMRERLFARLAEMALMDEPALLRLLGEYGLADAQNDVAHAQRLFEQILWAEQRPRMTTFHAFCQELLLRFPLEADVPAGYELLENTAAVEEMAWDALCLQATQQPEGDVAQALTVLFGDCGGLDNTRDALLNGFLAHRSDWWAYTEHQADAVAYATARLHEQLQPPRQPLDDFFSEPCCNALRHYADLLNRHATATNEKIHDNIQAGLQTQRKQDERFQFISNALLTLSGQPRRLKASRTLEQKLGAENQDKLLTLHDELCDRLLSTREQIRRQKCHALNSAWYRAGDSLLTHYQAIKLNQGVLDFADLEWRCYRLLHDSEQALWVQYKLDQKIDHLLLDEFQDTNPTQWQLILPLLQEMAGSPDRSRSVFLVGDRKQSIYGFRRANPQLQATASQWLQQHLHAGLFPLSTSWRSAPAITEFLNAVFSHDNKNETAARLPDFEKHTTHQQQLWGEVTLLPPVITEHAEQETTGTLRDPLTEPRQLKTPDAHYREGLLIADTIQALLREQRLILKNSRPQPLTCDDIIILLRTRTHASEYERALTAKQIPFSGIEKGGLLTHLEIQDMEALLNVLIAPFNNLALAQVLRSPIIGASDNDLQKLAEGSAQNWYDKLLQLSQQDGCSEALKRAARCLPQWRTLLRQLPVHDLLDRIFYQGDIVNRYLRSSPPALHATVSANLQHFLGLALQIESGRYPSVTRFLLQLKTLRVGRQQAPDTPAIRQSTAKVRMMTIHAAKGLEAPVVFLADGASTLSNRDTYDAMVDWPADNLRPRLMMLASRKDESPQLLDELRDRQARLRAVENTSLLYVALSRAQNMLVISAAATRDNAVSKSWYGLLRDAMQHVGEENGHGIMLLRSGTPVRASDGAVITDEEENTIDSALPPTRFSPVENAILPSESIAAQEHGDDESAGSNRFQAQRYGSLLHKALECFSAPTHNSEPDLATLSGGGLSDGELRRARKQALAIINNAHFDFLFNPVRYDQAYKEVPLRYIGTNGRQVSGIIDRLVLAGNEAWIIDFKYSDGDQTSRDYSTQLNYYAGGIKKIWPQRIIRKAILFTQTEELVEMD